jgi:diguanylate cyclase (GGDEF)-like protein/PAS domain S-box-containing protein
VSLYAGDSGDESNLAFRTPGPPGRRPATASWAAWLYDGGMRELSQTFSVAGKSWRVAVSAPTAGFSLRHDGAALVLIAGLVATLAGAAIAHARVLRTSRRRRAGRRNGMKLRMAYELLNRDMRLRRQEQQVRTLGECARQAGEYAVVLTSASGPDHLIEQVGDAFERMTGYSAADAIGRNGNFLWADDHDQPDIDTIRAAADRMRSARVSLRMYRKDGTLFLCGMHIFPVAARPDEAAHFVVAMYDLSAHARYLKEIEFQANRDAATGLVNQNLLLDRLMQAIAHANRYGEQPWVIAIDFNGKDARGADLGAEAGDVLWSKVAERLQSLVRLTDTVARLVGGQFVLLLAARGDEGLSPQVVRRLLGDLRQPFAEADSDALPACSVGVAVYPDDGDDALALIANACNAMDDSRSTGDDLRFYSPKLQTPYRPPYPAE